jgi:hypothetical protein
MCPLGKKIVEKQWIAPTIQDYHRARRAEGQPQIPLANKTQE